jgi:hypothetical protein
MRSSASGWALVNAQADDLKRGVNGLYLYGYTVHLAELFSTPGIA